MLLDSQVFSKTDIYIYIYRLSGLQYSLQCFFQGGVVYTTGHYPSVPAAAPHCYPTGVAVPPHGSYPTGSHHPPPVYPGAHGAHGTYPASGPMGGYAAPPMNPAYPSPYPQPGMNPSGMNVFTLIG